VAMWPSLLRPWPGRKLPPELRPGPVARQAAAFPGGLRDPQLETLLTRIDTGQLHRPTGSRSSSKGT